MTLAWCVLAIALAGSDKTPAAKASEPEEIWPMRLREAVDFGLRECPSIRVTFEPGWRPLLCFPEGPTDEIGRRPVPKGATPSSIVVEPVDVHASLPNIKSEVTSNVRSVEREYWHLAVRHVELWAADRAVNHALDVKAVEEAFGNPACPQDFDDYTTIQRRLTQFAKDLRDRTADVIAAERQLRNLIGVPESDNRRIIPITPPAEAPLAFAWGTCLDSVPANHSFVPRPKALCCTPKPNLIAALDEFDEIPPKQIFRIEDEVCLARWCLALPPRASGFSCCFGEPSRLPPQPLVLLRKRARHSPPLFDRAVLEAQSSYTHYATAKRLRVTAEAQMEAQHSLWYKGLTSAARYLDAVEQFTTAVATASRELHAFNLAVSAVNQIQGTILDQHEIIVQEPTAQHAASDGEAINTRSTRFHLMEEKIQ